MAGEVREQLVAVRMSTIEHGMLTTIADEEALSMSDILRQLVRKAYAERYGNKKPKAKPRP